MEKLIKCPKCKAFNIKETIVCGNCGYNFKTKKEKKIDNNHIKEIEKNKQEGDWFDIILCLILFVLYVVLFNIFFNGIIAIPFLLIAKHRNNSMLKVISWLGIGVLLGTIAMMLIIEAWFGGLF